MLHQYFKHRNKPGKMLMSWYLSENINDPDIERTWWSFSFVSSLSSRSSLVCRSNSDRGETASSPRRKLAVRRNSNLKQLFSKTFLYLQTYALGHSKRAVSDCVREETATNIAHSISEDIFVPLLPYVSAFSNIAEDVKS